MQQIKLGDISVDVARKRIKNMYLRIYPSTGRVRIAAPWRMDMETIRSFAISKLSWIKRHQSRLREQEREPAGEYVNPKSHFYLGQRYPIKIIEDDSAPKVVLMQEAIELHVGANAAIGQKRNILNEWYRQRLKEIVPAYISKWEEIMAVEIVEFGIKKMRTRWGSCNGRAKRIWLNLELAKKSPECLEYVIVHEMVHLLERGHNKRFAALMDRFLPQWKSCREELNRFPIGHRDWNY